MAVKGNLRDFSVTQLFNLINLARKTGTRTVEGLSEAAWVAFNEGKLIYAQLGSEDGSLIGILSRSGKLNPKQIQLIRTNAGDKNEQEICLLLINAGYLSQQEVLAGIREYLLASVYRLFTWNEGHFRFDNKVLPPEGRITLRLAP